MTSSLSMTLSTKCLANEMQWQHIADQRVAKTLGVSSQTFNINLCFCPKFMLRLVGGVLIWMFHIPAHSVCLFLTTHILSYNMHMIWSHSLWCMLALEKPSILLHPTHWFWSCCTRRTRDDDTSSHCVKLLYVESLWDVACSYCQQLCNVSSSSAAETAIIKAVK